MKKVAILTGRLSVGGGERVASNVSLNLPDMYKLYLMIVYSNEIEYDYKGELVDLKTPPAKGPFRKIRNLINKFLLIRRINKLKNTLKIDSTISFWHYGNIYNILSKGHGKRIITIHSLVSENYMYQGFFADKFTRLFYKRADVIVAVSQYIKFDLVKNYKISEDKIKVIYNPFDISRIQKLSRDLLDEEYVNTFNCDVIISIARISREKGHEFLIKAFDLVRKQVESAVLVFLGSIIDENYYRELKSLIDFLKLNDSVYFINFDKNPYKYLSKAKILTVTSFYEGLPCVIVEALACGIPVVSVDCKSGPREILAPDTDIHLQCSNIEYTTFGILTPPMIRHSDNFLQVNALARSYIELLTDKTMYDKYSVNSLKRAMDFDVENIISKYEEIIDE